MLKLISKLGCSRCESIKTYLTERNILFNLEMAEEEGYNYWRKMASTYAGKTGFPILIDTISTPRGEGIIEQVDEYLNGTTEEIINGIDIWYPKVSKTTPYTWGE